MPAPLSSIFYSRLSNASPYRGISDFSEATAFPAQYVNCTSCYERRWVWYATARSIVTYLADSTVEDIPEADLYRYTRHRWVYVCGNLVSGHVCWLVRYNEAYNLSQRYVRFDLQELVRIAVKATYEEGARRCMLSWICNHVITR